MLTQRKLTDRQEEVLNYIKEFLQINNFAPTSGEIATHFNINLRPAQKHVERLYVKGYINKIFNVTRGIVVLDGPENN
jgi:repressor LexA